MSKLAEYRHKLLSFKNENHPNGSTERFEDTFLPYLALDFAPADTPDRGNQCGLYALMGSFNAAMRAFRNPDDPPFQTTTIEYWRGIGDGAAYQDKVDTRLTFLMNSLGDAGYNHQAVLLNARSNYDKSALNLILEVANEEHGTHFQLGIITAGIAYSQLNNRYTATIGTTASERLLEAGPVLWIFNNNRTSTNAAHPQDAANAQNAKKTNKKGSKSKSKKDDAEALNHWESFKPCSAVHQESPGRYVNQTRDWSGGAALEADIERGVWQLTQDTTAEDEGHLHDYKYTFLRETPPSPNTPVPQGFKYMINSINEIGLVNEQFLRKTETRRWSPGKDTDPLTRRDDWRLARLQNKMFDRKLFKVIRVLPHVTKNGKVLSAKEDGHKIPGVKIGDFMLERGRVDPFIVNATKFDGSQHQIPLERLQKLERPWGFADHLSCLTDDPDVDIMTRVLLRSNARARGLTYTINTTDDELRNMLRQWKQDNCKAFRLHTVGKNIFYQGPRKVALYKGELVYKVPDRTVGETTIVRDYTGRDFTINENDLEEQHLELEEFQVMEIIFRGVEVARRGNSYPAAIICRTSEEPRQEEIQEVPRKRTSARLAEAAQAKATAGPEAVKAALEEEGLGDAVKPAKKKTRRK